MSDVAVNAPPPGLLRDLITLTKPRIISLLLVTTVCAMFAAQQGVFLLVEDDPAEIECVGDDALDAFNAG